MSWRIEQIIACLPATHVRFFQICTLIFGQPVPKFQFYSSTCEDSRRETWGSFTPRQNNNTSTPLIPLRWRGQSVVTLVFSHPLINLHLNLSQTSWRLNLTTCSSKCVCVCDGLRVIPGEHCQERQGWRVSLQTLIPPETETQSVASWPFGYQAKRAVWFFSVCAVASVVSDSSAVLWAVARQVPLSMGFSRQECWDGLPCRPPGDLPDPGIKPHLSRPLHWQVGSLPLAPPGKPNFYGWPFYVTVAAGSWHFVLFTYLRALLSFSYVILSFFFLCPHIFAKASDLTTRKIPCSLSSHSRMPQFSSGDRSRSRTNSHRWELWRPLGKQKKKSEKN